MNNRITKHNIHLIPQYKFVYKEDEQHQLHKNVDVVLRFEKLGKDLTTLFNHNKFPHAKRPRKHYPGSSKIRFDTADEGRNQKSYLDRYTPSSIALVNHLYAKDFELFGFKMIDPSMFETIDKTSVCMATSPFDNKFRSHSKSKRTRRQNPRCKARYTYKKQN